MEDSDAPGRVLWEEMLLLRHRFTAKHVELFVVPIYLPKIRKNPKKLLSWVLFLREGKGRVDGCVVSCFAGIVVDRRGEEGPILCGADHNKGGHR